MAVAHHEVVKGFPGECIELGDFFGAFSARAAVVRTAVLGSQGILDCNSVGNARIRLLPPEVQKRT